MLAQHCFPADTQFFCAPAEYQVVEGPGTMVVAIDKDGQPFPNSVDVKRLGFQLHLYTDYGDEGHAWTVHQIGDRTLYSFVTCGQNSCGFQLRLGSGEPAARPPAGTTWGYLGVDAKTAAALHTALATISIRVVSGDQVTYTPLASVVTLPR